MNYRRLSLYLDKLQAFQVRRLAYLEKWETADLLRVLVVLGLREEFGDTEDLTKRLTPGQAASSTSRPLKAQIASSVVLSLRLPEGLAIVIDAYARRTSTSRNQTLARLILAGTRTYCQTELLFLKAYKASRTGNGTSKPTIAFRTELEQQRLSERADASANPESAGGGI